MGNENKCEGLDAYAVRLIKHKARQLVGRAGFVEADRHDLEQELVIDLLQRLPRFDPTLAKRETFITRIVEHQVATLIETQKAGIRDYRRCAGSLDERREDRDEDAGNSASDLPPVLDQKEYRREVLAAARRDGDLLALRADLARVLAELPAELRKLVEDLHTATASEIARKRCIPRSTLYEAIARLRNRFDNAGLHDYLRDGPTDLDARR
ncbi:MAG: sigma factor [Deltaproteobacteria bacterium]